MVCTRIDLNAYSKAFDSPYEKELLQFLKEHFKLLDTDGSPEVLTKQEYEKICTRVGASTTCTDRKKGTYSWDEFYKKFQAVVKAATAGTLVSSPNSLNNLYTHLYPGIWKPMINYWTSPGTAILHQPLPNNETQMTSELVGQARVNCQTQKKNPAKYGTSCENLAKASAANDLSLRIGRRYTCFPTVVGYEFDVGHYRVAFVQQIGAAICEKRLNTGIINQTFIDELEK